MAKTLLNGVNEVLKKAQIVLSTNPLTSLTNSGKQIFIDQTVQVWNEAVDQLYSLAQIPKPKQTKEGQITLTQRRDYRIPSDLVRIHWPLRDEINGQFIYEYPGGYMEMRKRQSMPANWTGTPQYAAITPDGELYLDREPSSDDTTDRQYKYLYDKDLELSSATDTMPFTDNVFRAMVPVVTELFRYNQENRLSSGIQKVSFGRALRELDMQPRQVAYKKWHNGVGFDPLEP